VVKNPLSNDSNWLSAGIRESAMLMLNKEHFEVEARSVIVLIPIEEKRAA
jgi:hypothetical protein